MNKKITIVIPVYNSEQYISRCIDSILSQTINNYKILIINDGSKDNSQKIIEDYKVKYPDIIKSIYQENQGVAKTRNKAIDLSDTEYIMFIDNDDYIDKDYLETLYKLIDDSKLDLVLSGFRRPNDNNEITDITKLTDCEWSKMMIMTPWAKIFRTSFLKEKNIYFLDNNIGEDIYFNILAVFETDKIKISDYIGYNWFNNTASVSNTNQKNIFNLDVYNLLNSCYNELKKRNLLEKNYEIIEAHFIRYIYWFIVYSTVGISYKKLKKEYKKLFKWLKERFPNYKKNKLIGINKPKGDVKGNRRLYTLCYLSQKIGLGVLFVYSYNLLRKILKKA